MNIDTIKKIHFIGVGGIGMSAAAKLMIAMGKQVSGSDVCDSEIVQGVNKKGAKIYIGHRAGNVQTDIELAVYSQAVQEDNVERIKIKKLGINEVSYPQLLGMLSREMRTIAVSGTNGKSTTTAMLGLILEKAGLDPTVIVGGNTNEHELEHELTRRGNTNEHLPPLKATARQGESGDEITRKVLKKGGLFVVEACEYREAMLNLKPQTIVLTNIEADHLDYYKDLAHIKRTFKKYISQVSQNNKILIFNNDDENIADIIKNYKGNKISYGIQKKSDLIAKNLKIQKNLQIFDLIYKNKNIGKIKLKVPGIFNVYNALAAIATALSEGAEFKKIQKAIGEFNGICRRFEIVGQHKGAIIISDYAHHPTAIKQTIKAAKEFYPKRRIVAVFQPHSWNRTKMLFNEFVESFDQADLVILSEVYHVEGREDPKDRVSSEELVEAIRERWMECVILSQQAKNPLIQRVRLGSSRQANFRDSSLLLRMTHKKELPPIRPANTAGRRAGGMTKEIIYAATLPKCRKIILDCAGRNDIVLLMGAGDIWEISNF